MAYAFAGNLNRAIPLLEQTLVARERILGTDHPVTRGTRDNLAAVHRRSQDAPPRNPG
jgi:hypothetical protein